MTTTRHLVYDPAGGHLVRDPASGHLIYAAIASFNYYSGGGKAGADTQSAPWPGPYPSEATAMANAVTAMQAASWGSALYTERWTYKYLSGDYYTECRAKCVYHVYDTSASSGAQIRSVILNIVNPVGSAEAETYRLKVAVSATSTPASAWADIYDAPQLSGLATNGDVGIPVTLTLSNYLFVYLCADSYAALTVAGAGGRYARADFNGTEQVRVAIVE